MAWQQKVDITHLPFMEIRFVFQQQCLYKVATLRNGNYGLILGTSLGLNCNQEEIAYPYIQIIACIQVAGCIAQDTRLYT